LYIQNDVQFIVAIGDNDARVNISSSIVNNGGVLASIVHPKAVISNSAKIGAGTFVAALSVINANAIVGDFCIINTGAIVEHDCKISNGVHVSPNVSLAGSCSVGELSWLGIGSVIINDLKIASRVIVGAGSVVINNIPSGKTVAGVPAKVIALQNIKPGEKEK